MNKTNVYLYLLGMACSINSIASVAVFGPRGGVVVYEKDGDEIVVRQCAKNSLRAEIEKGCALKEGTPEVRISESNFSNIASKKFVIPEGDLAALSSRDEALRSKKIKALEGKRTKNTEQKMRLDAYKAENPDDYDSHEEAQLLSQEKIISEQISIEKNKTNVSREFVKDGSSLEGHIKGLLLEMEGKKIRRVLRYSSDRNLISFKMLDEISSHDSFVTSKGAIFLRSEKIGFGVAWEDPSGMIWGEAFGLLNHVDAAAKCRDLGGALPSKEDFERFKEYFELKENRRFTDGGQSEVYRMMPDMKEKKFWSSTIYSNNDDYAYYFNGDNGSIYYDFKRKVSRNAFRCVSR